MDGRVGTRTGASERRVLTHCTGKRRVASGVGPGTLGRCSRAMTGGLEMRVLDGANTRSLIPPGHESSVRSTQFIRRWGLLRESVPGSVHW